MINTAGNGPKSQDFWQETLRAPPLYAPTEVFVDVHGYDSIEARWRGVSTGTEGIMELFRRQIALNLFRVPCK